MDDREAYRERFRARVQARTDRRHGVELQANEAALVAEAAKRGRPPVRSYDVPGAWGKGNVIRERFDREHKEIMDRQSITCVVCGETKPLTEYKARWRATMRYTYDRTCKVCRKQQDRRTAEARAARAHGKVSGDGDSVV